MEEVEEEEEEKKAKNEEGEEKEEESGGDCSGLLIVSLEKIIPDHKKARTINIK